MLLARPASSSRRASDMTLESGAPVNVDAAV
jgi:hypothetical protein